MTFREVLAVKPAHREDTGGLETRVALSDPTDPTFDPFLILGHHGPQQFPPNNSGMPFSDHPHRGFETVTFVLEGSIVHTDSSGHRNTVGKGGVQWMTAGAGVVHSEQVPANFLRDGGLLEIIQLWVNLPARLKMTPADYTGMQAEAIPKVSLAAGSTMHLVAGEHDGVIGPVTSISGVFMSWIDVVIGARTLLPAPMGRTVLLYIIRGDISVGARTASGGDLVQFAADGDTIELRADSDAAFLFAHAGVIGEPVVSGGPFIMNTRAEVEQAFHDYRAGRFGNPPVTTEIG